MLTLSITGRTTRNCNEKAERRRGRERKVSNSIISSPARVEKSVGLQSYLRLSHSCRYERISSTRIDRRLNSARSILVLERRAVCNCKCYTPAENCLPFQLKFLLLRFCFVRLSHARKTSGERGIEIRKCSLILRPHVYVFWCNKQDRIAFHVIREMNLSAATTN